VEANGAEIFSVARLFRGGDPFLNRPASEDEVYKSMERTVKKIGIIYGI
jgi:hypothetical protein